MRLGILGWSLAIEDVAARTDLVEEIFLPAWIVWMTCFVLSHILLISSVEIVEVSSLVVVAILLSVGARLSVIVVVPVVTSIPLALLIVRRWDIRFSLFMPRLIIEDFLRIVFIISHGLSLVQKVVSILHEIDLLEEELCLLVADPFLLKHLSCSLLELVICPFDLSDVDSLFLSKQQNCKDKSVIQYRLLTSFISVNHSWTIACCGLTIAPNE